MPRRERINEAAERGDVDGVLGHIERERMHAYAEELIHPSGHMALRKAIKVACKRNPGAAVLDELNDMLAYTGALRRRIMHFIDTEQKKVDVHTRGLGQVPEHLAREWLPRLSRVQTEEREIIEQITKTLHVMGLPASKRGLKSAKVIDFPAQAPHGKEATS